MDIRKVLLWSIAVSVLTLGLASCGGGSASASAEARPQADSQPTTRQGRQQQQQPAAPPAPTIADVLEVRAGLMGLNVPCGLGIGEGSSEREAAETATRLAREGLVSAVAVQTHRFGLTYAHNVPEEARKRWEDRVALMTNAGVSNAPAHISASERGADGVFRVHTLMILDPTSYKQALENAASGNDEFNRRAQRAQLMAMMDAIIVDFNSKSKR